MERNSEIVVIGVGNILFKDEGVGIYAAKYLEENYRFTPAVDIIDGGTLGFKLMTYYQSYEKVIDLVVAAEIVDGSAFENFGGFDRLPHFVEGRFAFVLDLHQRTAGEVDTVVEPFGEHQNP